MSKGYLKMMIMMDQTLTGTQGLIMRNTSVHADPTIITTSHETMPRNQSEVTKNHESIIGVNAAASEFRSPFLDAITRDPS